VAQIGSLGRLGLQEGYYVYVGSAFGSGGLRARLGHHLRLSRRPHWHIDYLRRCGTMREIWFTAEAVRQEHRWAGIVASLPGAQVPMARFGASDCACAAHLFYFREPPSHDGFALAAGRTVKRVVIK
jgi:Uri superfamily endonuclease